MSRDISVHTFRHAVSGSVIHVNSVLCEDIDYDFFDSPFITAKPTDNKGYNVIYDEEKEDKKRAISVKLTSCDDCKDPNSVSVIDQNICNTKLTDIKNKTQSSIQLSLTDVSADNSKVADKNDFKEETSTCKEGKYMNLRDLMNCIAYSENKNKHDGDDGHVSKVHSVSPDILSVSTDTSTDLTDVTPCPSSSGCSSMSRPEAGRYTVDKSVKDTEGKEEKSDKPVEDSSGSSMKFLLNALDSFDRHKRKSLASNMSSNQKNRLGRKNMSFSNEQYWKIERENNILLRKLEHLRKGHPKHSPSTTSPPRLPSSALNRRKQQVKIDHDNMILLKKIEQAKPSVHIAASTVQR